MKWSVGITTAPRAESYLDETIASIKVAGWPHPIVFAEPQSELWVNGPNASSVQHQVRLGPWGNFLFTLNFMLASAMRDGNHVDRLLIFQDDVLVARNCREWLERELAFPLPWHIMSLYTSNATVLPCEDFRGWFNAHGRYRTPGELKDVDPNWFGVGACAIAMTPDMAIGLLHDPPGKGELTKADYHLSTFCIENGVNWLQHHPSPVRHIGRVSTLGMKPNWAREEREWMEDASLMDRAT